MRFTRGDVDRFTTLAPDNWQLTQGDSDIDRPGVS